MGGFLLGTDPTLRQTKTPNVDTFAAGVGFTAGSSTSVTLTADPGAEQHLTVFFDGVGQHRSTYSVSGTTLTFDTAIPTGTAEIEATYGVTEASVTVPDNSVTLAKLAGGTDGELITWDASGDPAAVAAGTSGHFLKSQGAGSVPVFAADNKGAMTFISNTDISNAATYDFTSFTAASYEHYVFYFQNLIPATDDVHLWCRTSTDGGSSYDAGSSDYTWGGKGIRMLEDTDYEDSRFSITGDDTSVAATIGSDTNESGISGVITLFAPHATAMTHMRVEFMGISASGTVGSSSFFSSGHMAGYRISAANVDGFRILFESGNIESGTITAYGLANAQ